jgi:hypothetical protein
VNEGGELTRQGRMLALRTLVLAGLLIALGFAVGQPVPAIAFAIVAVTMPVVALRYLRRRAQAGASGPG